jgi:hypothetical protein
MDLTLLAAGVALHLGADGIRNRGWCGIVRAACPTAAPRVRDVQVAAFAGGGVNGVVPARGGDALKLAVLRRRAPGVPLSTLAATLVADSLLEGLAGVALLAWALTAGVVPLAPLTEHPALAAALAALAALVAVGGLRLARRRLPNIAAGLAVLGRPRALVTDVLSWQLLARAVRLVAIACCLAACGLPASAEAALLTMAVEGATRVRVAPVSGTLRLGLLAYGLPALTGAAVPVSAIVAYLTLVTAARSGAGLAVSLAVLARELHTCAPRRLLAAVRRRAREAAGPLQPALERPAA